MVFLLIFVYKITINPSVVKCTKPNKKMYKITKSGFVRSFIVLPPFPCPLQKKTIQYIEREKHFSSPVLSAGCLLFPGTKATGHAGNNMKSASSRCPMQGTCRLFSILFRPPNPQIRFPETTASTPRARRQDKQ